VKFSPSLRTRLQDARRDIALRHAVDTAGWSDDQLLSALSLINTGLDARDAAAIVTGDAVLEDGRVDYDPGCAWIDFMLARRNRTHAECERIVAQWEAPCRHDADVPFGSNVVALPVQRSKVRQKAAIGH
jgi:hypothetical protein